MSAKGQSPMTNRLGTSEFKLSHFFCIFWLKVMFFGTKEEKTTLCYSTFCFVSQNEGYVFSVHSN